MKPLIVANWKCNPATLPEAKRLFGAVKGGLARVKKADIVACPPFVYLSAISNQQSTIKLGGQDCFWEEKGAFTGEVSPKMLKNMGCQYVIVGHSERRRYLGETDEMVNKKMQAVVDAGLTPILCVGETLAERKNGKTTAVLSRQLVAALTSYLPSPRLRAGLRKGRQVTNLVIAYEPVWAIGAGKPCGESEAAESAGFLRETLARLLGKTIAAKTPVLYGGSVNSQNAAGYIASGIDGLLIGGASLAPKEFIKIVKSAEMIALRPPFC